MTWNIALGFFYYGYCLVYLGAIPIVTILATFQTDVAPGIAQGLLNGCIPVGAFLGALSSSLIISRFSRR